MKWTPRRGWLLAIAALLGVLFVVKTVSWVSVGCPLGFALGSCGSNITNGRWVTASSDHLFESVTLTADSQSAVIDLGPRQVVLTGDRAMIDQTTRVDIPAACKAVEVIVRGDSLKVLADGQPLPQVASAPAR